MKSYKNILFTLLAIVMVLTGLSCRKAGEITTSLQPQTSEPLTAPATPQAPRLEYWTCSMHPQVKEPKPGNCPICGMTLIPLYATGASATGEKTPSDQGEVYLSQEGIRQASVRVEPAEKRGLSKELLIFGSLGYNFNLHRDVIPLVSGRIEKQFIDFNLTEVKKGASLISIYSTEAIAYQEEYLKALRERWLSTFYERELLDSMVKLAAEKLQRIGYTDDDLKHLQEDCKVAPDIIVRAPISGSIVGNMVHIGEMAKPDQPLYHIVPLDELWFNAQVFEPDLGLLELGQKVRITTKSFPGEEFVGKLAFIGRTLEASNRTIPVRFTIPNPKLRLLPNLSANGALEIPLGNFLSVPNSAVLDLGTRHVVYIQKEVGAYVRRNVRVGQVTQHYTKIIEGLTAGDLVVTSGAFLVDAQSQLRSAAPVGVDAPVGTEKTSESPPAAAQPHHH